MQRVEAAIASISVWMARVGGVMLLAASLTISYEVVVRKMLFLQFNVGTELSSYALAVGASWAFSYALLQRAHVRVDVIRKPMGQSARAVLDLLALIALAAFAVVLCFYAGKTAATSWELGARENTPLGTPLIIPQGLWFVGLLWFALVAVEQTAMALLAFVRGRMGEIIRIAGPAEAEPEIVEALAGAPVQVKGEG